VTDFEIAQPDERTLAAGEYVAGALILLAILAPIAWTACRARQTILPTWTGAPARIAEATLALSTLILLSQLLGTFQAFATLPLILTSLIVAAATELLSRRYGNRSQTLSGGSREQEAGGQGGWGGGLREAELSGRKSQETPSPPATPSVRDALSAHAPAAPTPSTVAVTVAAIACAAVVAGWAVPTLISIAGGMGRADTLWYHMPLSTRFAQTGSLADIYHFDPIFLAAYYPANSSILHAIPILAWSRDIVSPLLNLGFLGIGLASAWCIGRPWGLGPQAMVGGAIALGSQMLIEFQAGQALNDITGTAMVLAAAAILVNAYAGSSAPPLRGSASGAGGFGRRPDGLSGLVSAGTSSLARTDPSVRAGIAVAGLAAGLAVGMKLSFLAPAAALLVGLIVIAGRGERVRTAAWFALPAILTGGYWYARNLIAVGNPIPMISSVGPIELPGPERGFELRPGFSVAHYWNEPRVWVDWFFPGLEESFGVLWPLTLVAIVAGAAYALRRGTEPILRVLGAVVLATALAYLVTPLTAAGEEGNPISFEWNVRYVAPAAAIGLAILPCLPALRATPWRRAVTLVALAALLAVTVASLVQWQQGHVKGAVAAGLATLAAFALGAWLLRSGRLGGAGSRRWAVGLAAGALIGALAGGWVLQDHYLERRYQNLSPERHIAETVRFGTDLRDARVAISGVRGVFNQYPFYGTDLSNRVQWLGIEGDDGSFQRIPTCEQWRQALADGEYTHVVTMYDPYSPGMLTDTKEGLWTREDPAARRILRDGPVSVFELQGEPDPATCGDLPDLSRAELTGASVNRNPTANQP